MKSRVTGWMTLLAALVISAAVMAQGSRGSIGGRLIDENGDVITGLEATLTMRRAVTEVEYKARIQANGEYEISGLPAGAYDLRIPVACCLFRSFEQKSLTIVAGQALKQDINLRWGSNLGTIGDDPGQLSMDMRARAGEVSGPAPRTPEGKPDLSGMWIKILDAPDARAQVPKLMPWASEMNQQLQRMNRQPASVYCLPEDASPIRLSFPQKIVQTKDLIVHLTEFMTPGYRQIFLDGRPHPPADEWNPAWLGHSVGHWEGDALVVETVGFNEITPGFSVHTEQLKIIERYTRPSKGRLEVEISATDSGAWVGEFRMKMAAGLVPNEEILEFVCPENNFDALQNGPMLWRGRP
jgi:hypothetical protein